MANSKNIALVLGSGGARGLAQIGVIEELDSRGYTITQIAGCSMGAVIGGIYAAGHLSDFKKWITNLDKFGVYNLMDFTLSTQGFIKGDRVFNEIKKFVNAGNIEDLKIKFTAVAVDLMAQKQVVFSEGNLFEAIRASVAIPSVLTPVYAGNQVLVDGGVMNPLPLDLVHTNNGERVVAVDLNGMGKYKAIQPTEKERVKALKKEESKWMQTINKVFDEYFPSEEKKKKHNYYEIINLSFTLMQNSLTETKVAQHKPDVLIRIPKAAADVFQFFKAVELIDYGRAQAVKALNKLEEKKVDD